ncbi:MAG: TlpA family protein disulfide reductase [Chloroflexia bacterium]
MKPIFLMIVAAGLLLIAGCDSGASGVAGAPASPTAQPTPKLLVSSKALTPSVEPDRAVPVIANSEFAVGQERFVFGIVNSRTGQPIKDVPVVGLQFFKVNDDGTATKIGDGEAIYRSENLPAGVFVVRTAFKEPGKWGALFTIRHNGEAPYQVPLNFDVLARGSVPMIGDAAPPSKNVTKKDVKDLKEICSALPHDDMHDLTIADAIKSGKPTIVLFATPGFCESLTCGPDMELTEKIEAKYRDKANFIHIETPADHPQAPQAQVPTVQEWGLKSEPWLFLIDKNGKIAERFEGGLTLDEVDPEVQKLFQ